MPGPDLSGEGEETDTIDQEYEEEDSGDTVIISPTFSFKCEAAGIFPHRSDKQFNFFYWLFHVKNNSAECLQSKSIAPLLTVSHDSNWSLPCKVMVF